MYNDFGQDYFMGKNIFQRIGKRFRKIGKGILKVGALSLIPGALPIAATAAVVRRKKARKILGIAALGLIPGAGPIVATAAVTRKVAQRVKAKRIAKAKQTQAVKKVVEPDPVKAGELVTTAETVPAKKTGMGTWLIFGGLASAAMFLMGE